MICSNLTTFVVESPTLEGIITIAKRCDLLKFNYLCGRITNARSGATTHGTVVICSNLTTFVVESPTLEGIITIAKRCDLLKFNYLCGRITNARSGATTHGTVVICSNLTTFVVESPTESKCTNCKDGCDLLKFNYLCGRITNSEGLGIGKSDVVICSNLTTFVVESPTFVVLKYL